MNANTIQTLRTVASAAREVEALLTEMLRTLSAVNRIDPLPAGFLDHAEDLKSARGTIERVAHEITAKLA